MAASLPGVAPVIAIDGPAGAGKSTVARALAQRLGFFLLDTGAIYRAVALAAARSGVSFGDGARLAALARDLKIRFDEEGRVWLAGAAPGAREEDVSTAIRTPEISQAASTVSAHPEVRAALLDLQRQLAARGRCVVEGRDIGTVILPWAPVKIFLTAEETVRAHRRYEELKTRGTPVDLNATLAEIKERDDRDTQRAVAPLKKAADAILVDTSALDFGAVLDRLEQIVRERLGRDFP